MDSDADKRQRAETRLMAWADKHLDALYGYAFQRVRHVQTAEDLVQETFLAAIQNYRKFKGQSSEVTWLIGILRHKIADHFRRQAAASGSKEKAEEDEKVAARFNDRGGWAPKPGVWEGDPAHLAEKEEFWDTLKNCLSALPEPLAHAFIMREMEEQDADDVCQTLEISNSNLWVRLHRARLRLRDCLEFNWFASKEKDSE